MSGRTMSNGDSLKRSKTEAICKEGGGLTKPTLQFIPPDEVKFCNMELPAEWAGKNIILDLTFNLQKGNTSIVEMADLTAFMESMSIPDSEDEEDGDDKKVRRKCFLSITAKVNK